MAINIEFAYDLTPNEYRNYNLRLGFDRASQIPGIAADIIDDNRLVTGSRRTADSLMQGDTRMWCSSAFKCAQGQHRRLLCLRRLQHVEAHPVVLLHTLVQQPDDVGHKIRRGVGLPL